MSVHTEGLSCFATIATVIFENAKIDVDVKCKWTLTVLFVTEQMAEQLMI